MWVWILLAVAVVGFVLFLSVGNKSMKNNNVVRLNKWNELSSELSNKGFNQTSQIKVDSIHYSKELKDYLPERVVSIDSTSNTLIVSYLANIKTDEKANIVSCDFQHDVIAFDKIKGGSIVELGESTKSVGTAIGSQIGNSPLVGGVSSTSTTSYIEKLEYTLKLNDIDNPEYSIVFIDRKEPKTSLWYEKHYKRAVKLNSVIETILEKQ